MADALDLLGGTPPAPAPAPMPGEQPPQTWERAAALAPVAQLGGLGLDQAMWQGGDHLYHATRQAQDVPQPVPEDALWGTTGQAAPPLLAARRDPGAGLDDIAAAVGGVPERTKAFAAALGQTVVDRVAAHANPGGDIPAQGQNATAAVVLARWKSADEQGLLKGEGFDRAKRLFDRVSKGGDLQAQETADLVEAMTRFEDATQWVAHPELSLHPLVGLDALRMDAAGLVTTRLHVLAPDGTPPADRLRSAAEKNPTAMADHVRSQLVSDWRRNVDEGQLRRWRKDKTYPTPPDAFPPKVLGAAYRVAASELGVKPDEVRGLVPVTTGPAEKMVDDVQPIDWRQFAGTLDPVAPDQTRGTLAAGSKAVIEVQPDGSQRALGSWGSPTRGLVPTPVRSDGLAYMAPAEPAHVETVTPSHTSMDWDGFTEAVKPGTRLRIDAAGVDPERDHRAFLAELNKVGISPTSVGLLNPVTKDGQGHLPMAMEFATAKDMADALGHAGVYSSHDWTAYLAGPGEAPPGAHQAWESWVQDRQGRWGSTLAKTPSMNSVAAWSSQPPPDASTRLDDHATILGNTPKVEVVTGAGTGPFAVEVNGTRPSTVHLAIPDGGTPAFFYGPGVPPVPSAVKLTEHGDGVRAVLPDAGGGKVDPMLATRVESLLRRVGVAGQVEFAV